MVVHAHPDDEATSTGGVLHKYSGEGAETVLVTCTDGELGDGPGGLKPGQVGHDPNSVRMVRAAELAISCRELGVGHLELLGYKDSGMAEWARASVDTFAGGDIEAETSRLSELIERYRPEVIISYGPDGGYGHPDHIRTHEITKAATVKTGIPRKLYYTVFPKSLARRVLNQMKEAGIDPWELGEIEFDPDNPPFGVPDEMITTVIDVARDVPAKLAAVRAHSSQMDNSFFAELREEVAPLILGQEYYIRASDDTGAPLPESDLFAGIRK
jgi:LmbE family N-acetylglucosaminyl deacetylase